MKHLKTINLILFGILSIISFELKSQTNTKFKTEIVTNNTIKKTYKLKDFKQSCCIGIVEYSLKEVTGFIKSEANVKSQEISVWFDKTKCTEKDIKEAINKTPYKITK